MRIDLGPVIDALVSNGFRITRIRKAMIEVFLKNDLPFSAMDMMSALRAMKVPFNKTTVYREIAFLKENGIIKDLQFINERTKRYELVSGDHHHHLICLKCKKVEDIVLEKDLEEQEKKIYESKGFKVLNHSLEFMGICQICR